MLDLLNDIHCFECTAALSAAVPVLECISQHGCDDDLAFLPAPRTWLEWKTPMSVRIGYLLIELPGLNEALSYSACLQGKNITCMETVERLQLKQDGAGLSKQDTQRAVDQYLSKTEHTAFALNLAFLEMINTPRVIGRKQHMPQASLERRMLKAHGMVGKFPLHAWTEIKLDVAAPKDAMADSMVEAHLTGSKPLHFVRQHVRGGVRIKAHFRGDPAIGIKRTRYKVQQKGAAT